jgi:hypothetical protein
MNERGSICMDIRTLKKLSLEHFILNDPEIIKMKVEKLFLLQYFATQ